MDLKKTQKQNRAAKNKIINNMADHFGVIAKQDAEKITEEGKTYTTKNWLAFQ